MDGWNSSRLQISRRLQTRAPDADIPARALAALHGAGVSIAAGTRWETGARQREAEG